MSLVPFAMWMVHEREGERETQRDFRNRNNFRLVSCNCCWKEQPSITSPELDDYSCRLLFVRQTGGSKKNWGKSKKNDNSAVVSIIWSKFINETLVMESSLHSFLLQVIIKITYFPSMDAIFLDISSPVGGSINNGIQVHSASSPSVWGAVFCLAFKTIPSTSIVQRQRLEDSHTYSRHPPTHTERRDYNSIPALKHTLTFAFLLSYLFFRRKLIFSS